MRFTYKNRKKGRLRCFLHEMSAHSIRLLHICLPLILVELIALVVMFRKAIYRSPSIALHNYPQVFEYIMISLVIAIAGAVILDISEKKDKK